RSAPCQEVVRQEADGRLQRAAVDRLGGFRGPGGEVEGRLSGFLSGLLGAGEEGRNQDQRQCPDQDFKSVGVVHGFQKPPWSQRLREATVAKLRPRAREALTTPALLSQGERRE